MFIAQTINPILSEIRNFVILMVITTHTCMTNLNSTKQILYLRISALTGVCF